MTTTATDTTTVYFIAYQGRVTKTTNFNGRSDRDRKAMQAYVNRNNAAAARKGDESKPYRLINYRIPA